MSTLVQLLRDAEHFYPESSMRYDRELDETVDEAADRIEQLEQENAILEKRLKEIQSMCLGHQEEHAGLSKDAERYRWIRHGDNDESVLCSDCCGVYLPRNQHLDEAIDRLLEREKLMLISND